MKEQILEIIEKNMPKEVSGLLQKRLAEADELETKVAVLEDQTEILKDKIEVFNHIINDFELKEKTLNDLEKSLENRRIELENRSIELAERKIFFDTEIMKVRMEAMNANMENMQFLVDKVFGHPGVVVRNHKSFNYTTEFQGRDQQSGMDVYKHVPCSENIETKTTETKD